MRWQTFRYNYNWADYIGYIDGWIPKFSLTIPLLGYLILFNDTAVDFFSLENLTETNDVYEGFNSINRLRIIYYGLVFLGLSNFIYRIRRPSVFTIGTDELNFVNNAISYYNYSTFARLYHSIFNQGHTTKDADDESGNWHEFSEMSQHDWESAKSKFGSMLRSFLTEEFFRRSRYRLKSLTLCLFLSSVGYALLIIAGIDTFIKVTSATFGY